MDLQISQPFFPNIGFINGPESLGVKNMWRHFLTSNEPYFQGPKRSIITNLYGRFHCLQPSVETTLRSVNAKLHKAQMIVKLRNCSFFQREQVLAHLIRIGTIKPSPSKVEALYRKMSIQCRYLKYLADDSKVWLLPDLKKIFRIYCDACDYGIGSALTQQDVK